MTECFNGSAGDADQPGIMADELPTLARAESGDSHHAAVWETTSAKPNTVVSQAVYTLAQKDEMRQTKDAWTLP